MMTRAFIAIGSNLGDRVENVKKAVSAVTENPSNADLVKSSSLYETAPWGRTGQSDFINCVIEIETPLSPARLLKFLKDMESAIGRTHREKWGPRIIDLDIIFYGDEIVDTQGLKIPHPRAHERGFVLIPLNEIAPGMVHPALKKTVARLAEELKDGGNDPRYGVVKRIGP